MSNEILKQAFERAAPTGKGYVIVPDDAFKVIKEALAKLEQGEPVASIYVTESGDREFDDWKHPLPVGQNILYTTPQQRTWIGLTDEETKNLWSDQKKTGESITKAIEAKLKEKNT